jgi:two-component system response regulator HydG
MTTTAVSTRRLLLVDDDEDACRLLGEVLERESYEIIRALSVEEAIAKYHREGPFDAVLTDLRMPGASGLDLLQHVRRIDPDVLVLVLTAFGDAAAAGEAIRAGAFDFVSKPYDLAELRLTLARALERRHIASREKTRASANGEAKPVAPETDGEPVLVGRSPSVIEVMKTVARVAPSQTTILVTGETGTGKELVARILHGYSGRAKQNFVAVNCSALAEGLLESELFGHVKGAFTGAAASRPGLFREADRGTLFLDEVGDISPALQARLLRAVQEHEVVPVGSETPIKVDVRLVAATHRDLAAMVREGRFREDLYYRLNVVSIGLPPLRERRQDIPLLIDHFLLKLADRHGRGRIALDPAAQMRLLDYDWPGNVRELQNVLERALVLAAQDVIGPEHLPGQVGSHTAQGTESMLSTLDGVVTAAPELIPLAEVEKRHVLQVLKATGANRERTSRILGISQRTLTRMLKRWGMTRPATVAQH